MRRFGISSNRLGFYLSKLFDSDCASPNWRLIFLIFFGSQLLGVRFNLIELIHQVENGFAIWSIFWIGNFPAYCLVSKNDGFAIWCILCIENFPAFCLVSKNDGFAIWCIFCIGNLPAYCLVSKNDDWILFSHHFRALWWALIVYQVENACVWIIN